MAGCVAVVAHGDFRDAVAVIIEDIEVDRAGNVLNQDVALPARVLVPGQFGSALIDDDEAGFAIADIRE
jgi:hypothetical protein